MDRAEQELDILETFRKSDIIDFFGIVLPKMENLEKLNLKDEVNTDGECEEAADEKKGEVDIENLYQSKFACGLLPRKLRDITLRLINEPLVILKRMFLD